MTKPKPTAITRDDVYAACRVTAAMVSYLHREGLMVAGDLLDNALHRLGINAATGMHEYDTPESGALLEHWSNTLSRHITTEHLVGDCIEAQPERLHDMMATFSIEARIIDSFASRIDLKRIAAEGEQA